LWRIVALPGAASSATMCVAAGGDMVFGHNRPDASHSVVSL
jgi:hypothetical protein